MSKCQSYTEKGGGLNPLPSPFPQIVVGMVLSVVVPRVAGVAAGIPSGFSEYFNTATAVAGSVDPDPVSSTIRGVGPHMGVHPVLVPDGYLVEAALKAGHLRSPGTCRGENDILGDVVVNRKVDGFSHHTPPGSVG